MFDNFFGPNRDYLSSYKAILDSNLIKGGFLGGLRNWMQADTGSFLTMLSFLVIFLIAFLLLLVISAMAQIIITGHSASILKANPNNPKITKKFSLLENIKKSKEFLLPVSVLNLILKAIVNIALIVISLPMIINQSTSVSWTYVVLFIILFPAAIIIAFIVRFMSSYIIIQGQTFKQAFIKGINLFKTNWLISVEMSFMLFLINILGSLAIIFIILAIANPLWFIGIIFNQYIYKGGFYVILAISYIIFFSLFALGASMLSVFNIASWTGLFMKLDKNEAESKIVRIFSDLIK
jgi:hypothetical protein